MTITDTELSFRHEFGSLVASLVKRFGTANLDMVEDAVQQSLAKALEIWPRSGTPDNPSAWLYTVSYREVISRLRSEARLSSDEELGLPDNLVAEEKTPVLKEELDSSLLQMLFVACHPNVPFESQLVFTLKTLCGFSVEEVAERLFISKDNAYKRFIRAKGILKQQCIEFDSLSEKALKSRLPRVRNVLYSLFSEGYFSSNENELIRVDLCEEAIYLTTKLSEHKRYAEPETQALLALMLIHFSMLNTRSNVKELVSYTFSERTSADLHYLNKGLECLEASASGVRISRFHIEANIAAEYALATSYSEVRWESVVASYELLSTIEPGNPVHMLNHAIALTESGCPLKAEQLLKAANIPKWLSASYIWFAVQGYIFLHLKELSKAREQALVAIDKAPSELVRNKLRARLAHCLN